MIPQEDARNHLAQFAFKPHEIEAFADFPPAYRALAELIIPHSFGQQRRQRKVLLLELNPLFREEPRHNPWLSDTGHRLAAKLFGESKASLLPAIWHQLFDFPFQTGQYRRPFREPVTADSWQHHLPHLTNLYTASRLGFAGLDVTDCARYSGYVKWHSAHLAPCFACVLADDEQGPALRQILADILQGEDDIGIISHGIIKGLLLSPKREDWVLVEQLLLAAQRQEGLRQTILECLDLTTIGALRHLIDVILEHDLARFSSVVRAVDVWFGFNWAADKKNTIVRALSLAKTYLDDPASVEDGLRSNDSLEVFIALWSVALVDIDEAVLLTTNLLLGDNRTQRLTGLYFLTQCGREHPHLLEWLDSNFGHDTETDYWALTNLPKTAQMSDTVYKQCLRYGQELPKEGRTFHGTVFNWLDITATPEFFFLHIIRQGQRHHLRELCGDISALPSQIREQLVRKILPRMTAGPGLRQVALTDQQLAESVEAPWKRSLIRQAAGDRNFDVMYAGLQFLGVVELEAGDKALITELLRRKGKEMRASLIQVVLAQPEATVQELATELTAGNLDQRLAGLEILSELHGANRLISYVLAAAASFRERGKLHKNEVTLLDKLVPKDEAAPCLENGFGVLDFDKLSPLIQPTLKFGDYTGEPLFARLINTEK
ncbi:MAG: hypothetical protein AAF597_07875, partial [Bacteroidota bacterium]